MPCGSPPRWHLLDGGLRQQHAAGALGGRDDALDEHAVQQGDQPPRCHCCCWPLKHRRGRRMAARLCGAGQRARRCGTLGRGRAWARSARCWLARPMDTLAGYVLQQSKGRKAVCLVAKAACSRVIKRSPKQDSNAAQQAPIAFTDSSTLNATSHSQLGLVILCSRCFENTATVRSCGAVAKSAASIQQRHVVLLGCTIDPGSRACDCARHSVRAAAAAATEPRGLPPRKAP